MHEERLGSQIKYQGRILDLRLDSVLLPNGREAFREVVVHPGAVAIAALNDQREILLIKQYRYAVDEIILEVPAGKLEKNEDPLGCAQRELAEETGFAAKNWRLLSTFFTTPGFCDEIMHLYLAEDLYSDPQKADDDEFIELSWTPLNKAVALIRTGEIKDLKTITGVLLADSEKR